MVLPGHGATRVSRMSGVARKNAEVFLGKKSTTSQAGQPLNCFGDDEDLIGKRKSLFALTEMAE